MANKRNWKISKKGNKILFVLFGISIVVAPTATIIYSMSSKSNYSNDNPWKDALHLDQEIDRLFSNKFADTKTNFWVGETKKTGSYVSINDIRDFKNYLRTGDWINELKNKNIVNEMLKETGATFNSRTGIVSYKDVPMDHLSLFPTILEYPYENKDKYGEVFFNPSNKNKGQFDYGIRFSLRLGVIDERGTPMDLKKTYDFKLEHGGDIGLSELMLLMNNSIIKDFMWTNGLTKESKNSDVLKSILKDYYNFKIDNMDLYSTITPGGGGSLPGNEIDEKANAKNIHVKYDSRKINSFDKFGKSLFNNHENGYDTFQTIFNKIGIQMPKFTNIGEYKKYDRSSISSQSFENNFSKPMNKSEINSYNGYVNYNNSTQESINDDIANNNGSNFNTEHNVFHNKVEVGFLDTINTPINIFYDQMPYTDRNISYNGYEINNDVKSVLKNIDFYSTKGSINSELKSKESTIKSNIENEIKKSMASNNVNKNVYDSFDSIDLEVSNNPTTQSPRNGSDSSKIYQDKSFDFNSVSSKVLIKKYGYSGNENGTTGIDGVHYINSVVAKDPNGTPKNEMSVININDLIRDNNWYDGTEVSTVKDDIRQGLLWKISNWSSNSKYPIQSNEYSDINIKINGPVKKKKLKTGWYSIELSAPKNILGFTGSTISKDFYINEREQEE